MSLFEDIKKISEDNNLTINEFFFLGNTFFNLKESEKENLFKKWKVPYDDTGPRFYSPHELKFMSIIKDSKVIDHKSILELSKTLKEIFPKGKKEGTALYWAEGVSLIDKRLRLFFKKYGVFSSEEIIDATKRYIESFNGNYAYMRTLKYFIFKDIKGVEEIENSSDLLTWIENKNDKDINQFEEIEIC